jgi:hypothetical protein
MRCKACDRILEDSELTRKDVHGNFTKVYTEEVNSSSKLHKLT